MSPLAEHAAHMCRPDRWLRNFTVTWRSMVQVADRLLSCLVARTRGDDHHNNCRAAALIIGAVLAAARVGAQNPAISAPEDQPRFQSDIVVTPERGDTLQTQVAASTVVLDGATLRTQPAISLGEALSFMAGFQVERGAFHAGLPVVSARGFFGGGEADYVLLLIDGVPALDVESGLADWSVVPLSSIRASRRIADRALRCTATRRSAASSRS